jgi:hypothetical protein
MLIVETDLPELLEEKRLIVKALIPLSECQLRLKIPHCTGRKVRHPRAVKVYSFNRLDENGTGW